MRIGNGLATAAAIVSATCVLSPATAFAIPASAGASIAGGDGLTIEKSRYRCGRYRCGYRHYGYYRPYRSYRSYGYYPYYYGPHVGIGLGGVGIGLY